MGDPVYDFYAPETLLVQRYAKFLFDRYESEQFPKSKIWLNQKFAEYLDVKVHEMDDFDW